MMVTAPDGRFAETVMEPNASVPPPLVKVTYWVPLTHPEAPLAYVGPVAIGPVPASAPPENVAMLGHPEMNPCIGTCCHVLPDVVMVTWPDGVPPVPPEAPETAIVPVAPYPVESWSSVKVTLTLPFVLQTPASPDE